MNVAIQVEFKADRKEPLGGLVRRVVAEFERSGLQPQILATFSDGPAGIRSTSAVERAIRKHPHLARFSATMRRCRAQASRRSVASPTAIRRRCFR